MLKGIHGGAVKVTEAKAGRSQQGVRGRRGLLPLLPGTAPLGKRLHGSRRQRGLRVESCCCSVTKSGGRGSPSLLVGHGVELIQRHCLSGRRQAQERHGWRRVDGPGNATIGSNLEAAQGVGVLDSSDAAAEEEAKKAALAAMEEERKKKFHVATYLILLMLGVVGTAITVVFTYDIRFEKAFLYVSKKFLKSVAARQALAIVVTMLLVRSGLTPVVKFVRGCFRFTSPWETSTEAYLLKEVYQPLELLLGIAACATLAESILPPLISVPKQVIHDVLRTILSLAFILSASRVGLTFKNRLLQEAKWKMELNSTSTQQRNVVAIDKLSTAGIFLVTLILGLQAVGLDIHSLLAIGGIGGLAIGLAGREIFENVFSGFLIMGSRPFDVGDEVLFNPGGKEVEGIVAEIGWYHTTIRSFGREMYAIPNSVFSKEVVLNITRKGKEWQYKESIPIRVCDLNKVESIVADVRRILRQDERVIQRLYRRVFLGDITREYVSIFIAFYIEVPNRDAYLAARQQMSLSFIDCIHRNGARLAEKKILIGLEGGSANVLSPPGPEEASGASENDAGPSDEGLQPFVYIPAEATDLTMRTGQDNGLLSSGFSNFGSPQSDGAFM